MKNVQPDAPKRAPKVGNRAPRELSADDRTEIEEAAHIPDRDQMFGVDHKTFPDKTGAAFGDAWSGDFEEAVKGDRDTSDDTVDELANVGRIVGPAGNGNRRRQPTPAPRGSASNDEMEGISDTELHRRAEALGIAGRERMSRVQLISAVREARLH